MVPFHFSIWVDGALAVSLDNYVLAREVYDMAAEFTLTTRGTYILTLIDGEGALLRYLSGYTQGVSPRSAGYWQELDKQGTCIRWRNSLGAVSETVVSRRLCEQLGWLAALYLDSRATPHSRSIISIDNVGRK